MCQIDLARGAAKSAEAYQEAGIDFIDSNSLSVLHNTDSIRCFASFRQAVGQPHNHMRAEQVALVFGKQDFFFVQNSFYLQQKAAAAICPASRVLTPVRAL